MNRPHLSRRSLLATGGAAVVALGAGVAARPAVAAGAEPPAVTPAEALRRLLHGNHRPRPAARPGSAGRAAGRLGGGSSGERARCDSIGAGDATDWPVDAGSGGWDARQRT
ncbi:hypothetical protein ACFY2R_27755 [Micromonospora olivasterospora]|uniref:Secreted protein n=1 Tax=Micromonospora olivasterospora TaxID=1880 RepID=A0A562IG64_MICOL|nr:hypothetical protein [Micromonospora olivasterospora]TWH69725.1 hypothetical protein JD77_04739 [Micromonospora olivasterospora]